MKLLQYLFLIFPILIAPLTYAEQDELTLISDGTQTELSVKSLRQEAHTEFVIFDPFSQKKTRVKGILLEDFLQTHILSIPKKIKLVAIDDYEVFLSDWPKGHWLIVTHENGDPISRRQRGPLRLVARDHKDKNSKNLRDFNNWIWMLQRIEVIQ